MKLDKIKQTFRHYEQHWTEYAGHLNDTLHFIRRFQDNWDFGAPDFLSMFNRSIDERIFKMVFPERHFPVREVMNKMIARNPVALKQMFLDLMYERVDIKSRVDHFILECDENFKHVSREVGNTFKDHFHLDFGVISVYLTLRHPDKYAMIDYPLLEQFLRFVEARNIPDRFDYENQIKMVKTINTLANKDDLLSASLNQVEDKAALTRQLTLGSEIIKKVSTHWL